MLSRKSPQSGMGRSLEPPGCVRWGHRGVSAPSWALREPGGQGPLEVAGMLPGPLRPAPLPSCKAKAWIHRGSDPTQQR